MTDYTSIIAECMAEIEAPLPVVCRTTPMCRLAGGCPKCFAEVIALGKRRKAYARTLSD